MSFQPSALARLGANRRLFLATYMGLALVSALVYLSQVTLSFVTLFGSRAAALGIVLIALPAILPYLISGIYAWQLISARRLGLYLFLAATAVGTGIASLVIVGQFDMPVTAVVVFWYVLGQIAAYGMAAEFLLGIEWP